MSARIDTSYFAVHPNQSYTIWIKLDYRLKNESPIHTINRFNLHTYSLGPLCNRLFNQLSIRDTILPAGAVVRLKTDWIQLGTANASILIDTNQLKVLLKVSSVNGKDYGSTQQLEVIAEGGPDISIPENEIRSWLKVFPNPFSHDINIDSELKIDRINIFSLEGKLLFSEEIPRLDQFTIEADLKKGLYILEATSNEHVIRRRIVCNP